MKFIAHDHYNNNFDAFNFDAPRILGGAILSERDFNVTNEGMTFFMLHKWWSQEQKLAVAEALHHNLAEALGHGLNAATCAVSDCAQPSRFEAMLSGIKQIDPAITTIEFTLKGDESSSADYSLTRAGTVTGDVTRIVSPSVADFIEPDEGWLSYERRLQAICRKSSLGFPPRP